MQHHVVVGGGAAGFFAAVNLARIAPGTRVTLLERSHQLLAKVRISGGGRCNVTHACFDPRQLAACYPRGERALLSAFHRFQPQDTIEWFESRGVTLKTEADGRMFPVTDRSSTIIDCLTLEAKHHGVEIRTGCGLEAARRTESGFELTLSDGSTLACDKLLLSTGGCKSGQAENMLGGLGHSLVEPIPSLFTFNIQDPWLRSLQGLSLPDAEASVPGTKLRERGPLLITHWGLSGPAILRLSAWGARDLHNLGYQFNVRVRWLPAASDPAAMLQLQRERHPARRIVNSTIDPLPSRLWEAIVARSGLPLETTWSQLKKEYVNALVTTLTASEFAVAGKSTNKDEFVTSGGVPLREVDFKTMQSKATPGLYFAGEVLDLDGITGGFNFQAAWTTGWIAAHAMAGTPAAPT